jgi:RNA-binding protein
MKTTLKQALKAQAHHLKPVILIGNKGLTSGVIEETNVALTAHELIKIKIAGAEKTDRVNMLNQLCSELNANFIQLIGNIGIIYRKNPD